MRQYKGSYGATKKDGLHTFSTVSHGKRSQMLRTKLGLMAAESVEGFFVYGTLRTDYTHGLGKTWKADATVSYAIVKGFKLIVPYDLQNYYPIAIPSENMADIVFGQFLEFDKRKMESKRMRADRIEGYPSLYSRKVVNINTYFVKNRDDIHPGSATIIKSAYIYYQSYDKWRSSIQHGDVHLIENGDWLPYRLKQMGQ